MSMTSHAFNDFLRMEQAAVHDPTQETTVAYVVNQAFPGHLHTPEYTRALFKAQGHPEALAEQRVVAWSERAEALTRAPHVRTALIMGASVMSAAARFLEKTPVAFAEQCERIVEKTARAGGRVQLASGGLVLPRFFGFVNDKGEFPKGVWIDDAISGARAHNPVDDADIVKTCEERYAWLTWNPNVYTPDDTAQLLTDFAGHAKRGDMPRVQAALHTL